MNEVKTLEAQVGATWRHISADLPPSSGRWLAIARTHFEEGFSALVRSIARPEERF